jgi:NADPH:quinone reductase
MAIVLAGGRAVGPGMRAVTVEGIGPHAQVRERELPRPEPAPTEVRIRVRAASFNPMDVKIRDGLWATSGPVVLGQDCAGTIDGMGSDVRRFREGDEVWAYTGGPHSNGAFAEYVVVPHEFAGFKPRRLTMTEASAVPVVGLTMHLALDRKVRLQPHHSVFVAGASGGLGSMAAQMLVSHGITDLVVTAGSDESARYLAEELHIDPDRIVRYRGKPVSTLVEEARQANFGRWFDVTIDLVGGAMKALCFELVQFDGDVISVVEEPPDFRLKLWDGQHSPLFRRSASLHYPLLGARGLYGEAGAWTPYIERLDYLRSLFDVRRFHPVRTTVVGPLSADTVREGLDRLAHRNVQGKLALTVS